MNQTILQRVFVILLLLSIAGDSLAEAAATDKRAAIKALLTVTGAEANRQQLTRTFTQQLISVLQANNTRLTPEMADIIEEEVDIMVGQQLEAELLQEKMYAIYDRYFTLEDIEALIAFNQSPIGIKANRVMPVLMRESMLAAQQWSEEIGPELSDRVRQRLAEEGVEIGR